MKKAIFFFGPSGCGKTTIISKFCKKYPKFKHCDGDTFKVIFSDKRSQERTEIGMKTCYLYACELIKRGYDVIIEAIGSDAERKLRRLLKEKKYQVIEISLCCSFEICLRNNSTKPKGRKFTKDVIEFSYGKHSVEKGFVIDVEKKSVNLVVKEIEKIIRGK